jgi:hypothetical protein
LIYTNQNNDWGFFGHRLINELAVFTLPPPLIGFYKKNIDYIRDHAVDPDMRRHASNFEAIRHYIDIDHWGKYPYPEVPREFEDAIIKYATFTGIREDQIDTLMTSFSNDSLYILHENQNLYAGPYIEFKKYFSEVFMPHYYDDEWKVEIQGIDFIDSQYNWIGVQDHFSSYGILPYNLVSMYYALQKAMREKDTERILRLSADIGHYIADAHVPLHTTENYNGQLTGQDGIHAFWESRIPELFAESRYDFYVGKAEYISDIRSFFWAIVLESNSQVDSVLGIEQRLRLSYPTDKQYCYDDRNGAVVRQPCPEFALAYQNAMGDMVENRLQKSIKALGDLLYSAWIEAGQPTLITTLPDLADKDPLDSLRMVYDNHQERNYPEKKN